MAKDFADINDKMKVFIEQQKLFFVATAAADGRINLSPKGMDTFRIHLPDEVQWLNVTGSGNETAAHLLENNRITVMFCAFEGAPMILRLFGTACSIHPRDAKWSELITQFPDLPGARQIIVMKVELVRTSCGMGVPLYQYERDREELNNWARKKGQEGIEQYWREHNLTSLDNKPTGISDK